MGGDESSDELRENDAPAQAKAEGVSAQALPVHGEPPERERVDVDASEASPAGVTDETRAAPVQGSDAASMPEAEVKPRKRRRKHKRRKDAWERALQGRRDLCYQIPDIAPQMFKRAMIRGASSQTTARRWSREQLEEFLVQEGAKIAAKERVVRVVQALEPDRNMRILKGIIVFDILMEQERYALPAAELNQKVGEYEKEIVKESKTCALLDAKRQDKQRLFAYETYSLVLEAAWRYEDAISVDEANLLTELRRRLSITLREHRLLETRIGRFPKPGRELHSVDEVDAAKIQLQKEGILWTFRDEDGTDVDVVPQEVMSVIRKHVKQVELQRVNYERLLSNRAWSNADLRAVLKSHALDSQGSKAELTSRILGSRLIPSQALESLGSAKLRALCREVGLVSYGNKHEVIARLIGFYDNLTFEPVVERDERAQYYAAYELLAARKYSELKAQGLITKQEDVDRSFERATDFLFEKRLNLKIERMRGKRHPDGKIYLAEGKQVVLWDCKSDERQVNLQDHLDSQFDGYMRTEASHGRHVLCFLVVGPQFTDRSYAVAMKYKMETNRDVPMITAGALKLMAEKWHAAKPDTAFPLTLLNLTGIIDEARVDELLSLVL